METLPHYKDVNGFAPILTSVTLDGGAEFTLCNRYEDVREAIGAAPFEAHQVISLQPVPMVLNPAHVASVRKLDEPDSTLRKIGGE